MVQRLIVIGVSAVVLGGCGGPQQAGGGGYHSGLGERIPPPDWMGGVVVNGDALCGFGVAGAGYNQHSPYPKRLSEERAVENLAGVLGTRVQEAIIDRETQSRTSVRTAHVLTVDEALVEKVKNLAKTEYWLDVTGEGPYAAQGFTYAYACIEANVAASNFGIDAADLNGNGDAPASLVTPSEVPSWLSSYARLPKGEKLGTEPDGRVCATGFSLPTFHPDKTFQAVVEDVRWQLTTIIEAFVSSYFEEYSNTCSQTFESMTLAVNDGISKGVIVTQYWYDRDGIGPLGKQRSTYGYGCVYPVDVMISSATQIEEAAPEDEREVIRKVRERAESAFEDLDAEIEKRERAAGGSS